MISSGKVSWDVGCCWSARSAEGSGDTRLSVCLGWKLLYLGLWLRNCHAKQCARLTVENTWCFEAHSFYLSGCHRCSTVKTSFLFYTPKTFSLRLGWSAVLPFLASSKERPVCGHVKRMDYICFVTGSACQLHQDADCKVFAYTKSSEIHNADA